MAYSVQCLRSTACGSHAASQARGSAVAFGIFSIGCFVTACVFVRTHLKEFGTTADNGISEAEKSAFCQSFYLSFYSSLRNDFQQLVFKSENEKYNDCKMS
ncbi:uncharacterized protein LOC144425124 [Styela clava]